SGDPFGRAPRAQVVTRSDIKMKHACLSVAVASATVLGLFGLVSCGSESPPPAAGSGGAGSCGDSSPCSSGDGCCPTACTDANDADCSQSCVELTAGTCTP